MMNVARRLLEARLKEKDFAREGPVMLRRRNGVTQIAMVFASRMGGGEAILEVGALLDDAPPPTDIDIPMTWHLWMRARQLFPGEERRHDRVCRTMYITMTDEERAKEIGWLVEEVEKRFFDRYTTREEVVRSALIPPSPNLWVNRFFLDFCKESSS
jgi:hypothetical protein